MRKKLLAGILALTMVCGMLGCGRTKVKDGNDAQGEGETEQPGKTTEVEPGDPYGRFEETVTMTIGKGTPADPRLPKGETVEDNEYVRYIEEALNIDFTHAWQADSDTAYWEKVPLVLASKELPDVMVVRESQLKQMYEAGLIEDLTEAFYGNVSPALKAAYDNIEGQGLDTATFDGKLMGIPSISPGADAQTLLWIREDWRITLGLDEPETLADVKAIAKAFIEQDPDGNGEDDTIGFAGCTDIANVGNGTCGFDPVFASVGAYPEMWTEDENGEIVYGSVTEQTREGLEILRDMYAEGLIDQEFAAKDVNATTELLVSGRAGIFFGPWWMPNWPLNDCVAQNPKAEWKAYLAPLGEDGKYNTHMMYPSRDYLVVRKGYEHPEAVVRTCNMQFDISNMGQDAGFYEGQDVQFQWDCMPFTLLLADYYEKEGFSLEVQKALDGEIAYEDLKASTREIYDYYKRNEENPKEDITSWAMSNAYMTGALILNDEKINRVFGTFYGQTDTMESRWSNLQKLEDETFLNIIIGQQPIEAFDEFVEQWNQLGGADITEEVKAAVNR